MSGSCSRASRSAGGTRTTRLTSGRPSSTTSRAPSTTATARSSAAAAVDLNERMAGTSGLGRGGLRGGGGQQAVLLEDALAFLTPHQLHEFLRRFRILRALEHRDRVAGDDVRLVGDLDLTRRTARRRA